MLQFCRIVIQNISERRLWVFRVQGNLDFICDDFLTLNILSINLSKLGNNVTNRQKIKNKFCTFQITVHSDVLPMTEILA